jgi:flagellar hook-length control protein FliK
MNEPVIDNLFSAAGPRPDAGAAALGRRSDDANEFGDHLRQAGATTSESSSESWWRSAPEPRDSDQRPPDRNYQPPDANQSPPRPPIAPPPRPLADRSPPAESSTDQKIAPASNREDEPSRHDSDRTSPSVSVAANQTPAKPTPDKPRSDKLGSDKPATGESPRAAHGSADRSAKPKPEDAATAKSTAKPLSAGDKPTTTAKDTAAGRQDSTGNKKHAATASADAKTTAESADGRPATASPTAKLTKADANAKPADQTTATTSAAVAANAAAKSEAPAAAVDKPEVSEESRPGKVSAEHGTATQKQSAQAIATKGQSATKQPAAATATAGAAKSGDAAANPAVAKVGVKSDEKTDVKKKDATSADDKPSAEHAVQATPVRAVANQSTPNVAAITTATIAEATVKDAAEAGAKDSKIASTSKPSTLAAFGRLNREGLLTARGPGQAEETADAPQIDPARFVSRVARAIETAQDRGAPLNLRLSPPELGSMRLELSVKQGVMTAKVETDTAAARQALLDNLPKLRDRLAEQNIRIDRFDVDVRREGSGEQANSGPQQRQFQQHQQFYQSQPTRPTSATNLSTQDPAADPIAAVRTITDTSINLVA